jgi:hypothetical protein
MDCLFAAFLVMDLQGYDDQPFSGLWTKRGHRILLDLIGNGHSAAAGNAAIRVVPPQFYPASPLCTAQGIFGGD